jgi:hypothetical protein
MCERQLSNQNAIFLFSREYVCFDYIIHDRYYDIITETQVIARNSRCPNVYGEITREQNIFDEN